MKKNRIVATIFLLTLVVLLSLWAIPRLLYLSSVNQTAAQLYLYISSIRESDDLFSTCLFPSASLNKQNELSILLNKLESVILKFPKSSTAHLLSGRIKCLIGDYHGAVQSFSSYTRLKPNNPLGYIEVGFAYEKTGEEIQATEKWKSIEGIDQYFMNAGIEYQRKKKYKDSMESFERALLINPGKNETYYRMFLLYQEIGDLDKALEVLLKGAKESAEDYGLSNIYYQTGWILQYYQSPANLDGAWNAYSQALTIDNFSLNNSNEAAAYSNRGFILLQQSKPNEAIDQFKTAINLEPEFYWPRLGLGRALWQTGNFFEAKQLVKSAIPLSSNPIDAYLILGDFFQVENDIILAREMFEKALKIDPYSTTAKNAIEKLEGLP